MNKMAGGKKEKWMITKSYKIGREGKKTGRDEDVLEWFVRRENKSKYQGDNSTHFVAILLLKLNTKRSAQSILGIFFTIQKFIAKII